jgi:hypothetical protein
LPKLPVLIRGMWGLGDNVWQRPFVRAAAAKYDVWLETPWPELYADLDIKFVRGGRRLRTQQKNMDRQPAGRWSKPPYWMREVKVAYGGAGLEATSIIRALEQRWRALQVEFNPALFDLPDLGPSPVTALRPIAVVRPVTVRMEWRNEARNPRSEYVRALAAALMSTHTVIAVADLAEGREWAVGELPPAHRYLVRGELAVRELLALVRAADVVIGGVGWIVPAGLATRTKTFAVLGGHGGHNAPEKITDPRLDLSGIGFAMPEDFCRCTNMLHNCNKAIADPVGQFSRWMQHLRVAA